LINYGDAYLEPVPELPLDGRLGALRIEEGSIIISSVIWSAPLELGTALVGSPHIWHDVDSVVLCSLGVSKSAVCCLTLTYWEHTG